MIYEQRYYNVSPAKRREFIELTGEKAMPIYEKYGVKIVGVWETDIGERNEVIVMMAFEDLAQREKSWENLRRDEEYAKIPRLPHAITVSILRPTKFSPMK